MSQVTKSQFAKMCNVAPAAITKAVREGRVVMENKKYLDPTQEKNLEYIHRLDDRRVKDKAARDEHIGATSSSKTDADVARIKASTAQMHLKLAQEMKVLVLKKSVDKLFGGLYAAAINYILPQGQRIAPEICDRMGITDPEKVLEVQMVIDEENEKTVQEIKRVCREAIGGGYSG